MHGRRMPYSASGPNYGTGGAKSYGKLIGESFGNCERKLLPMTASASTSQLPEQTANLGYAYLGPSIWKLLTSTSRERSWEGRVARSIEHVGEPLSGSLLSLPNLARRAPTLRLQQKNPRQVGRKTVDVTQRW